MNTRTPTGTYRAIREGRIPPVTNVRRAIRLRARKPRRQFPWGIVVTVLLAGVVGLACSLRMAGA